jgi:23S rRNA U2552 (ribose-2'-O)-methylase RlmE/FtsJ
VEKIINNPGKIEKFIRSLVRYFLIERDVRNIKKIYYFINTKLYSPIYSRLISSNLTKLALHFGTDKAGHHNYTKHYQSHFHSRRLDKMNILEIGVGGHEIIDFGGHSLRVWKKYFPKSMIYSLDIHEKRLNEKRIKIFQGSQTDSVFLNNMLEKIGGKLDIIIDDGSHINDHVITSFEILFPSLEDGGIYVVEDTHTSYWPSIKKSSGLIKEFNGNSDDLNSCKTTMGYFKSLCDGLNHMEYVKPGYQSTYFDRNIKSIHFYHNLIFIFKGDNNIESLFLKDNDFFNTKN